MTINRSDLFKLAWKSAKGTAASYGTLRAAFAAALRRVWSLAKAMVAEEARRPVRPVQPAQTWASENTFRAAAVASRKARLGSFVSACW